MRKILSILFILSFVFVLGACTREEFEIAMITDIGDIDDGSFNQGTWEGIVAYAEANEISHKYYQPRGEATKDYFNAIRLAVRGGAKIVVTPGFLFEQAIHQAQTRFPDVTFVLIDGAPHAGDWVPDIEENTLSIFFKEHESAFLAGYAAVQDGQTSLGFMGGLPVPAVRRFGIGFVAGAYLAAKEKGVTIDFPATRYDYLNTFGPSDEVKNKAATWYSAGTGVIHVAAGGAGTSVMAAAQEATGSKWVVGVDVDQGAHSKVVISAMKGLGESVQQALTAFYAGTFEGGKSIFLGAAEDGVGLPMESSRFTTFTAADYDVIYAKLVDGTIVVPSTYAELVTFLTANGITLPTGFDNTVIKDE
jgi:basic membrane protein A and related proteins